MAKPKARRAKAADTYNRFKLDFRSDTQEELGIAIVTNDIVFAFGPAGCGKAQPLDAAIKTPSGWATMGDMYVGKVISAPDGTSTVVTGVYPQGKKDIYRITFEDGRSTECCDEHLWQVYHYDWSPAETRYSVINTAEIRRLLACKSKEDRLYVDLITPEEGTDVELPMDPYLMGALIGDGGFPHGWITFSNADPYVITRVREAIPEGMELNQYTQYDYGIVRKDKSVVGGRNELLTKVRDVGLDEKLSYDKFIPEVMFTASLRQRMSLLKGLMDTDGTVSSGGSISYSTSSQQLALDVQRLIRSIGGLAKIGTKYPTYTHQGEKRKGAVSYQVNIRVKIPGSVFGTPAKQDKCSQVNQYGESLRLRIKDITLVGKKEAQCISVSHPDHLYITDDWIVTHNTFCVSALAADALDAAEIDKIVITRPVIQAAGEDLGYLPGTMEEKMDPYLKPILDVFEEVWSHDTGRYQHLMETRRIEVSPLAFSRGRTFKHSWVICDEAQNMTEDDVRMLLTRLGEGSKIILCGDPTQRDRKHARGWEAAKNFLMDCPGVSFVTFSMNDIVRHQTVSEVLKRWATPIKPEVASRDLAIAS